MRSRAFPMLLLLLLLVGALMPSGGQASQAPVLSVRGEQLTWTAVEASQTYRLFAKTASGRRLSTVAALTVTPPAMPGETVTYRVKALLKGNPWSNPVTITYPRGEEEPEEGSPPPAEGLTVGLNAGGWGPSEYADLAGASKFVRLESRFATDTEVGAAASAGVTVASWLVGTGGTIGAISPTTYAAEVVALFKRYGKGGTFWAGRKDLGGQAVEVLNEPYGGWFWTDPNNYAAYTNLLRAVHRALAANFPAAVRPRVLASWDGKFGLGWKALGGLAYCDGVTAHPYGGATGSAGGALGNRPSVEEAHAQSGKPVYVTEIGWPTAIGHPSTGDSQQWSEAQQAANITNFVRWARATNYVAMVDVFGYVDYGANDWYGIERRDRTHKPAFTALAGA